MLAPFTSNNTVGGPDILHCTAKGGAAADTLYSTRPDVLQALGSVTTLTIVGFVITPRTFGARVKLTPQQLTLWGNSDSPHTPKAIDTMFRKEVNFTPKTTTIDAEFSIEESNGNDASSSLDKKEVIIQGVSKESKTLVACVPPSQEEDDDKRKVREWTPTLGEGSRAHITIGCNGRDMHPRTTGYDLLLAVDKEQAAMRTQDNTPLSNDVVTTETEENETGNGSVGDGQKAVKDDYATEAALSGGGRGSSVATYHVEGAALRSYGDGVWVVYPHKSLKTSAIFTGFHNSN